MISRTRAWILGAIALAGCVPSGSAAPHDAGPSPAQTSARTLVSPPRLPVDVTLERPFDDDFDRSPAPIRPRGDAAPPLAAEPRPVLPGPDWFETRPGIWRIENGRLCGDHAHNHGIWLKRTIPVNARIEFDAVADSPDGDLKAEYWGDGRSYATSLSYTNATSYLTIFGGWHNTHHVLARVNEHAADRKDIIIDAKSDDPREKPVVPGQIYHFKVERTDGHTVRWWVDGAEMLSYPDPAPLAGAGHDHFGFNDWEVKVCFDNVRVVPLP